MDCSAGQRILEWFRRSSRSHIYIFLLCVLFLWCILGLVYSTYMQARECKPITHLKVFGASAAMIRRIATCVRQPPAPLACSKFAPRLSQNSRGLNRPLSINFILGSARHLIGARQAGILRTMLLPLARWYPHDLCVLSSSTLSLPSLTLDSSSSFYLISWRSDSVVFFPLLDAFCFFCCLLGRFVPFGFFSVCVGVVCVCAAYFFPR